MTLIGAAAATGSDGTCYCLGLRNFNGKSGLLKDMTEAKHYLTKAVDGLFSTKSLSVSSREISRK